MGDHFFYKYLITNKKMYTVRVEIEIEKGQEGLKCLLLDLFNLVHCWPYGIYIGQVYKCPMDNLTLSFKGKVELALLT